MRLTPRCMNLLRLLAAARWLTTRQIHRRFFARRTVDAARKRLRKLAAARYLVAHREGRMHQALYAVGREGRRVLEAESSIAVALERRPPTQREHFLAVNDVRIAAELAGDLSYFFAYWELPGLGWKHPLIPDAVFSLAGRTYALEFDRGGEGIGYFMRTKIAAYDRGLDGFPVDALLIVADREPRLRSLREAIGGKRAAVFATVEDIRRNGLKGVLTGSPREERGSETQVIASEGIAGAGSPAS